MQFNSMLLLLFIFFCSCKNKTDENKQTKFDPLKWGIKEDKNYPYRDNMLNDLVYNIKLKGFRKDSVLKLLGKPNRTDSNYFFYIVDQRFLGELPVPVKTKSLVIKFLNDTVEWRKIKE